MTLFLAALAALAADPVDDLDDLPESKDPPVATEPTAPAPPADPAAPADATPAPAPATEAAPPPPPPKPVGPVTSAQIQTAVDAWYGKSVPAAAVCVGRPELPAPFTTEVVAAGVTQKNAGCRMQGLMVGGVATPLADGLGAAVKWTELDAAAKLAAAKAWTTEVVLHFDAPMGEATAKAGTRGGVTVVAPFARRTDEFHVQERLPGTFTYDGAGKLVGTGGAATERWRTDLYQQQVAMGGVTAGVVEAAIQTVGGAIADCFDDKIAADPGFEGATRIAMVVGDGKVSKIAAEEESDPALTRCYANALEQSVWPASAKGTAVWSFAIVKTKL